MKSQLWAFFLLLALVVALAIALISRPAIVRWSHLRHLTAKDLAKREQALNYVVRFGKTDPAVIAGAIARLNPKDEKNYDQIVNAIDRTGRWRRPIVPDEVWVQWLCGLFDSDDKSARILAAHYLSELPDVIDKYPHYLNASTPVILIMLRDLMNDKEADVRYAALLAAAELGGKVDPYWEARIADLLLIQGTHDKDLEIARHAWIFLGLSQGDLVNLPPDWRTAPPHVAEAMLWAVSHAHPDHPEPAIEAAGDEKIPPLVRAMGIYALHENRSPAAEQVLNQILEHAHDPIITSDWQTFIVRAVLSVDAIPPSLTTWQTMPPTALPIIDATCYRTGKFQKLTAQPTSKPATEPSRNIKQDLADLAALEGAQPPGLDYPINHDTPDMLRLAAVAAAPHPKPDDLRPLLASPEPTMRDLACVVAADHFTKDQNAALVDSLLRDLDDDAKVGGAVLAGLTGVQGDLLAQKMKDENAWVTKLMMKLGLWMQGRMPEMARTAPDLFVRTDIPKSTLVLVLLHQKNPAGLDYLLNPRGEPPLDLVELFDQKRWWRVMSKYLPKDASGAGGGAGSPPFWAWADPELEHFQVDVLRDWYLVNREKIYAR